MTTNQKRVYCLYRVSTTGQVEKDDIPMQKQECRAFAARQGWEIVNELSEKGISGFKVSAKDRDAMQEIQRDATLGKFDILLVFMFDRLGRRDDETPFVVEWFVRNGIEVWSTVEGEQRFDNHVDKLMNYIRYWQASGESIKTSIRTKTRLGQIVQEGRYRGGGVPFGYRLEKQGRLNKKNHELNEIVVDDGEAATIRKIFELYVCKGYGSQRICGYLNEQGVVSREGKNFVNCTVQRILKNVTYLGILKSGETQSEIFPELQIIDPHTFDMAQKIMEQRSAAFQERNIPLNTKGSTLLSGNVFCGHCGARLTLTTNGKKYLRKDGCVTVTPKVRYVCYNKTRHPGECDGQTGYTAKKLDGMVNEIVKGIFEQIKDMPADDLLFSRQCEIETECRGELLRAKSGLKAATAEVEEYEAETLKVIRGTSRLDSVLLSKLYNEAKERAETAQSAVSHLEHELEHLCQRNEKMQQEYADILSWSELCERSELDVKKMILCHLIKAIRVSRDYRLEIELTLACEQFDRRTVQDHNEKTA